MAIAATHKTAGVSTSVAASFATASITPTANALQLLWVTSWNSAGGAQVPTVSGCGLTWVQVATFTRSGSNESLTLFRAMGAAPTSGTLTIDFAGITQDVGIQWEITEFTGVDVTGANGAGAIVQNGFSRGAAVTSGTLTLNALLPGSATVGGFRIGAGSDTLVAGSGYTINGQTNNLGQGWATGSETKVAGATVVNFSWTTSSDYIEIAVELRVFSVASQMSRRVIRPLPKRRGARWFTNPTGAAQAGGLQSVTPYMQPTIDGSRRPIPRQHRGARWFAVPGGVQQFQGTVSIPLTQPSIDGSRKPIPRQHRPARWFANPSGITEFESLAPPPQVLRPAIYTSRWPIPRQHRGSRWLVNRSGFEDQLGFFPPAQVLRPAIRFSRWPIPRQHRGATWWPNPSGTFTAGFPRPAQRGSHCRPILEIAFPNTVIDEPPTWTDISARVRQQGVHPRRGRSQELQQFSAGKLTATLDDRDRAFDPLNTVSPYYPNVDINKPVRLRGEYPWLPGLVPNPNFDGIDGSGSLAGWSLVGTGTLGLDPTNHYLGAQAALVTATATQTEMGVRSDAFPVAAGQYCTFSARVLPAAGTHLYAIKLEFFSDLAGTASMGVQYGPFSSLSAGSWSRIAASQGGYYVPNSAQSVRVAVVQGGVTNGDAFDADTVVFDYGTFQGIFPIWYGYLDKLTPKVEGLDRVTELEATDAFSLLTLSALSTTGYADVIKAGFAWDIFFTNKVPTDYWRLGDASPTFTFQDEYNLASLTLLGQVETGQPGALPADTDTAAKFDANPGGEAFSIGALLTHGGQAGAFECWLNWTDTGQTLLPFVGIASQQTLEVFAGWSSSPLLIAMAGDGATDDQGNAVPRGSLCMFSYSRAGGVDHWNQWWMKGSTGRIRGDGKWHHIMLKFSGSTEAYIDGVWAAPGSRASSSSPTGVDFGAAGLASQTFILSPTTFLGQTLEGVTLWDKVQGWDGLIDEVALYDYASGPLTVGPAALAHYKAGAGQWANQTPGQRVNSVLDTIGWPGARRNVGIDSAPLLQPVDSSLTQQNALSYLQSIESNDLGYFFMGADGTVTFLTRQQLTGAPLGSIQSVFGNEAVLNSAEVPFELAEPFLDQMILFNKAEVQQNGGATFVFKDAASVSKYWERSVQATGMLMANVNDQVYMAQWLVLHYKQPETRIEPLVLNPLNDDRVWKAALNLDVGELVEVRDRLRVASGYRSYIMRVQGVNVDITSDKWVFSLSLASADAQRFFTLDDPSLGKLSSGNRLGW